MKSNKGMAIEIITIAIVGFMCLLFFACWVYGSELINTTLKGVSTPNNITNVSYVAEKIYTPLNTGYNYLGIIGFLIIVGFSIATLIVAYYSSDHPILIGAYILVIILSVIFSVYVSNAYQNLLSNSVIGSTLSGFTMASWVMTYLPYWIAVIGLIGIGIMLSRINKFSGSSL